MLKGFETGNGGSSFFDETLKKDDTIENNQRLQLIELLLAKGNLFRTVPKQFELPRDPDDEPYLNLAIEANAQFLVTRDRDLLDRHGAAF